MNPASWTKSPSPIFVSNADTKQFGPGHNSFTVSEDGLSDVLVYHDRGYRDIVGDPLNDPNRRTRVQKLYWKADGTPDFGIPVPDGATPVRLRSYSNPSLYLRYYSGAQGGTGTAALAETQFRIVSPGLAGGSTVSFESTVKPGTFLRRSGTQIRFDIRSSQASFNAETSFLQRTGLADTAGVSFESSDTPGQFIVLRDGGVVSLSVVEDAVKGSATFYLE
jgi:hypothetical protein